MITLVVGGARSGKSEVAERWTQRHSGPLVYLATGSAADDDMAARIEAHRLRRDPRFAVVEVAPAADLAAALRSAPAHPLLLDALGTWVAGHRPFETVTAHPLDDLCAALAERHAATLIVTDEVGWGVHPETEVGRRFRDALGTVNQRVAAAADDVWLVVAGRVLRLDDADRVGPTSPR